MAEHAELDQAHGLRRMFGAGTEARDAEAALSCEVLIVVAPAAASLTEAYASIKRMSASGAPLNFRVLVQGARSSAEARLTFRNLAQAAKTFLGLQLHYGGTVPRDPALALAATET